MRSTAQTFAALKFRLLVNGVRRSARNPLALIGTIGAGLGAVFAALIGGIGLATLAGPDWDPRLRNAIIVVVPALVVFGWWTGPFMTGGVDETVDPARLVLLPLNRQELRAGQIAAGLVGLAPLVVLCWMIGYFIGTARSVGGAVVVGLVALITPFLGLTGSRAVATSLARLTRTRRGSDIASLIAALLGAVAFGAAQLLRVVSIDLIAGFAEVLKWTPPGMAGAAIVAADGGRWLEAGLRLVPALALLLAAGWFWSRQLDALLAEPSAVRRRGDALSGDPMAIFDGRRSRLPRTPEGAAIAKEIIYLARSPNRRVALLSGSALGLVYVVVVVGGALGADSGASPRTVLTAPIAMLFSVQYASNQLGVDPGGFWLEVATGPPPAARWAGRQLLGVVNVLVPVLIAVPVMAAWTGGWFEGAATAFVTVCAAPSIVGVGSLMSPAWVTPLPDSGNPFASGQSAGGKGCLAGLVALVFVGLIALLVGPASVALADALNNAAWTRSLLLAAACVAGNWTIWRFATRRATRRLPEVELSVLAKLDPRLNK